MLIWNQEDVPLWEIINRSKLSEALKERRGEVSDPSSRVFVAYYHLDEHENAPAYELGDNFIYYDCEEDGCCIYHAALEGTDQHNPSKLKDLSYFVPAWFGVGAAAAAIYASLAPKLVTETNLHIAEQALPEALETHSVDPFLRALIKNPSTKQAKAKVNALFPSQFKDGKAVYRHFKSRKFALQMYHFVTATDRRSIQNYGHETALVVPLISSKADAMVEIAQSAFDLGTTELTFNDLEKIRSVGKTTIDTFSSLVYGDHMPAGAIISSVGADAIRDLQHRTLFAEGAARKAAKKHGVENVFNTVQPLFDTMKSVLRVAEESVSGPGDSKSPQSYQIETAVGKNGGPPSPWFPDDITEYLVNVTTHVGTFQEVVNQNLNNTAIGVGCKLLGTLMLGEPLECSQFGDIFSAARFVDEYSISQAMSEMDEADMRANNAIQTAQNVIQEIKDIALDSASGRGNLEWIVGDAVAHLAVEFSKNRDPAAGEVDDDELALERVQSKEWFRILKRKLSADGISATDRAGKKGFLSKVWVLKNMMFPLLHPFHRNRGALRVPCNSLSTLINNFAFSQQKAWQNRRADNVIEAVATINVSENERVGFNRNVFNRLWGSVTGTGLIATYILPHAKLAMAKWNIVESSFRVECRMRAAYHYYPYLGARCKLNRGKENLKAFASKKLADAQERAVDAKKSLLQKLSGTAAEPPQEDAAADDDPFYQMYEPLRLDAQEVEDTFEPDMAESPPTTNKYRSHISRNKSFFEDSIPVTPPPTANRSWLSWFGAEEENEDLNFLDEYNSQYAPM